MRPPTIRSRIELGGRESAREKLGIFGERVGDRIGASRRTQNQIDDYCIRHLVLGLLTSSRLYIPQAVTMLEPDPDGQWPDALLEWPNGTTTGAEITTATSENYQRKLTEEERIANALPEDEIAVFNHDSDGYAGEAEAVVAKDIATAIVKKTDALNSGKYGAVETCDLVVYESSEGGLYLESDTNESISKVVHELHFGPNRLSISQDKLFRHVHLVTENFFVYSLLGDPRIYSTRARIAATEAAQ